MVAGDAAHNFPPFGGQGIASGFRDSISLAWRLALIIRNPGINYEELLTGWYIERKQQVEVCMLLLQRVINGSFGCNSI
jgi:2-polyprenyl-6-methoxyphenol hydroxylase-like FAD-dependent oxidoreductase